MSDIFRKLSNTNNNDLEFNEKILLLIDKLEKTTNLETDEFLYIINNITTKETPYLFDAAYKVKYKHYQNRVYLRALIEISNYCVMGCKYCGINKNVVNSTRFRLSLDEILERCEIGYNIGYKTFVLQGGEDPYFTDEILEDIIIEVKKRFPDIRITLSIGERSKESYKRIFDAGANRYLLRHESASKRLYEFLHPKYMSFENRMKCLFNLKEIGFQTGGGFMVGSPSQVDEDLVQDLLFLKELSPEMIGIGPYLTHSGTEFKDFESGRLIDSLVMIALVRLILPKALIPATTALGTLDIEGREKALKVGANVIMPNISPVDNKKKYDIYENKICSTDSNIDDLNNLNNMIKKYDHVIDMGPGDFIDFERRINNA